MIVFRSYFKILKSFFGTILLYVGITVGISAANVAVNDQTTVFSDSKPVVVIEDQDNSELSRAFTKYVSSNSDISELEDSGDAISDALFFEMIDYYIKIPAGFENNFMAGQEAKIDTRSVPNAANTRYAEMLYNKFWNTAEVYREIGMNPEQISSSVPEDLSQKADLVMKTSSKNTMQTAGLYFNFMNYALLGICIFMVGMGMAVFHNDNIKRRNMVSPMPYGKMNAQIFLANALVTMSIWLLFIGIGVILFGQTLFSIHGLLLAINSLIFSGVALSIGFLLGNLVKNRNAQGGIINVIALGSSFLCGSFVPQAFLGDSVLNIARVLPSYWYIKSNDLIAGMGTLTFEQFQPILVNMIVMILFGVGFFALTALINKYKIWHRK